MHKKSIILIIVAAVVVITGGVWYYFSASSSTSESYPVYEGEPAVTVVRTASGFEPEEVTIQKGDIVRWVNQSGDFTWPASDLHPTHGVYPEFDPERPFADGESWQFRFDEVGVWEYHDHIWANKTGTVTVTN